MGGGVIKMVSYIGGIVRANRNNINGRLPDFLHIFTMDNKHKMGAGHKGSHNSFMEGDS